MHACGVVHSLCHVKYITTVQQVPEDEIGDTGPASERRRGKEGGEEINNERELAQEQPEPACVRIWRVSPVHCPAQGVFQILPRKCSMCCCVPSRLFCRPCSPCSACTRRRTKTAQSRVISLGGGSSRRPSAFAPRSSRTDHRDLPSIIDQQVHSSNGRTQHVPAPPLRHWPEQANGPRQRVVRAGRRARQRRRLEAGRAAAGVPDLHGRRGGREPRR